MTEPGSGTKAATAIFLEFGEMGWWRAIAAIGVVVLAIVVLKRFVPWLAGALPDRFRLQILPWEPILRFLLLALLLAYVTPLFIRATPENLLAIGGAMAVALGFAFKDYASSLLAGVVALYERPYRPGDWIRIEDTYGEVKSLGLRTVRVVTSDDTAVAIPHLKMWTEMVHNANSGQRDLMCVADFFLHPDHDGQRVRQALHDVAMTSPYLQLGKPVIVVAAERPWGTHYRLKAYPIDSRDQFQFVTDLTLRGKSLLNRHGVRPAAAPAVAGPAE